VPVLGVVVAVAGASSQRSEERHGSKVLAGSPSARLMPCCRPSATGPTARPLLIVEAFSD
jgi:hypothetical protein